MIGLYIHVPFCKQKCPYCDFYSINHTDSFAYSFTEAVKRNLAYYNERYDTVYFGGGTPSLIFYEISRIIADIRFSDKAEITIEANPGTINIQGLSILKDSGVNRISFGVQSFSNSELFHLGRKHTAEAANNAVQLAASAGFDNISIDLMLGIPRQTPESVKRNIKIIKNLPIKHVSVYMLKIEPNTPFATRELNLPSDDETAILYSTASKALIEAGFSQYEISNFARPGFECKHNLKYWKSQDYIGIGPSAHSFYRNERFAVDSDLKKFLKWNLQPTVITDTEPGTFKEFAMLKLRLSEGLTYEEMNKFGVNENKILKNIELIPRHYIEVNSKGIAITNSGFAVSNQIIGKLLQ